jgi:phage-related protein
MSKFLSVATVIEKNKIASDTPFLVCLEIDVLDPATNTLVETFYLVRNAEDVVWQGHTYVAMSFDIEFKSEANAIAPIQLRMFDYTRAVMERMQAYGGGIGSTVRVIVLNAGALDQPAEIMEHFSVVGAQAQNYTILWTLGAENILEITFPKRRQLRDRCSWRYKSGQCKYTGAKATCDLSLQGPNGCAAHFNTINFGGFPGINSNGVSYG